MVKQPYNNGFTLVEALLVLSIVCVLSVAVFGIRGTTSLTIFMEKMMSYCVLTQEKAYVEKTSKKVEIFMDHAYFDDILFVYPENIACETISYTYNAKGNISMANTIVCKDEFDSKKLIFQLGSGRVRIE